MRIARLLATVLMAGTLFISGCGGDGDKDKDEKAGPVAEKQPDPIADKARADRISLTLADLGSGWAVDPSPAEGGDSDQAFDKAFDDALAAKGLAPSGTSVDVESPDFLQGESTGASSRVSVFEEEAAAARDFSVGGSDDFIAVLNDTFNTAFKEELAKDPALEGVTVSNLTFVKVPFPVLGKETFALKAQTTVRAAGTRSVVHFDVVTVRQDRAVAVLFATNSPQEFPPAELQALATKMAERMGT